MTHDEHLKYINLCIDELKEQLVSLWKLQVSIDDGFVGTQKEFAKNCSILGDVIICDEWINNE